MPRTAFPGAGRRDTSPSAHPGPGILLGDFRALLVAAFLAAAASPLAHADAPPTTFADHARSLLASEIAARGLDPAAFFAAPIDVVTRAPDGATTSERMTVDEALERLGGGVAAPAVALAAPRATAGNVLHVYANLDVGGALAYDVSASALAPATPGVLLPPPATPLLFHAGGPLVRVDGSYRFGAHTVGTTLGSNADTEGHLPVVSSGTTTDHAIDSVGYAQVAQAQACLFGLCLAFGLLLGDGAMAWDGSAPAAIPTVP